MEQFDALLQVAEKLLGPNGCPWDIQQTFRSLQPFVLEEAHEVIEAVDLDQDDKIIEELGDLLYTIVFYGALAEKTKRFSMENILNTVREKLIRRHPHVFGEKSARSIEEVVTNWEAIKKEEKGLTKSAIDDMPPTLHLLLRAQKMLKRAAKAGCIQPTEDKKCTEEELGEALIALLQCANHNAIDAESALRRALFQLRDRLS
jgi:MazG family protein